jgi:hypothetical protein
MNLSEVDENLFYKLNCALLFYVNTRLKTVNNIAMLQKFYNLSIEEKAKVRNALYENIELIELFVKENLFNFATEEVEIVKSWKQFVSCSFYLVRFLTDYAVFLDTSDPPLAYGVLGIIDPLDEMLGNSVLILVNTFLLQFKEKIIYDGLMCTPNIYFGSGIRKRFNRSFQKSKARFGIITSLPYSPLAKRETQGDKDMLKFYLKNEDNREYYWEEIQELVLKSRGLLTLYHQEMGKVHARRFKKELREMGFKNTWFAVLQGLIIASGPTKDNLQRNLDTVLPPGKAAHVYIFQLKK